MSETVSTGAGSTSAQGSSGAQASSQTSTAQGSSANAPTPAQGQGQAATAGKGAGQAVGNTQGFTEVAPKAETPQARKLGASDMDALVEVTIDGQKQDMPLREAIKLQQLEKVSRQRISEAQRERAEAQRLVQMAKADPERYMREVLGLDPDNYAEERLARKYELSQMSPEARESMELKSQIEQMKSREAKSREPLLNDLKNYVTEQEYQQILAEAPNATIEQIQAYAQNKKAQFQVGIDNTSNELLEAWQQEGLPKQKIWGQLMAQTILDSQKRKGPDGEIKPLQAREAAAKVKGIIKNSVREMFSQLDPVGIQEFLGEDILQKLRQFDVDRVSKPQTPPWASAQQQTSQPTQNGKSYMSESEYRAWLKS